MLTRPLLSTTLVPKTWHGAVLPAVTAIRRTSECVIASANWRDDVPNALTVTRVLAVPVLLCMYGACAAPAWSCLQRAPAAVFAACACTDGLDGYLARRWDAQSEFGAFLDPVADKLLVCACLALLAGSLGTVVALPAAIVVCREVAVSALREWMGERGHRAVVAVGRWGKVKTATQMVSMQLLLLSVFDVTAVRLRWTGVMLLYAAAVLSCTSAAGYFKTVAVRRL